MSEPLSHPSPHHNARPKGQPIRVIVMHSDAGKSDAGTLSWLQSPASKVSYHVLIGRMGQVYRIVDESRRAWHAGVSSWNGFTDVNSVSLGLAFCCRNDDVERLTPLQIAAAREVVRGWREKHPGIQAVVTHASIAMPAGRKTDPERCVGFSLSDYTAL